MPIHQVGTYPVQQATNALGDHRQGQGGINSTVRRTPANHATADISKTRTLTLGFFYTFNSSYEYSTQHIARCLGVASRGVSCFPLPAEPAKKPPLPNLNRTCIRFHRKRGAYVVLFAVRISRCVLHCRPPPPLRDFTELRAVRRERQYRDSVGPCGSHGSCHPRGLGSLRARVCRSGRSGFLLRS